MCEEYTSSTRKQGPQANANRENKVDSPQLQIAILQFPRVSTQPIRINLLGDIHFGVRVEVSPETSTVSKILTFKLVYLAHCIAGGTKVWAGGGTEIG